MPKDPELGNLVVFGDSLGDNGAFRAIGETVLAYPWPWGPYGPEGFTNGDPYSDTLAGLLSVENYQNYALGGAEAIGSKFGARYIEKYASLTLHDVDGTVIDDNFSIIDPAVDPAVLDEFREFDINLAAQVDRYIADLEAGTGTAPDGTRAVLEFGVNDLSNFDFNFFDFYFGNQAGKFAARIGDALEAAALRLFAAGVEEVDFLLLADASFLPAFGDANFIEKDVADELVDKVNDHIMHRASVLNDMGYQTDVVRTDVMSLEVLADKSAFGFRTSAPQYLGYSGDPTWVQQSDGSIVPVYEENPASLGFRDEERLFLDEIHPTKALHDLIAVFTSSWLTADEWIGTTSANSFRGGGGIDFAIARAGADRLELRSGDDIALAGQGHDKIFGNRGEDIVIAGGGNDTVYGGKHADFLAGSNGHDRLFGGDDDDILIGGLGNDLAYGEAGDDVFFFIDEILRGGDGVTDDRYDGGAGDDSIFLVLAEEAFGIWSATGDTTGFGLTLTSIENVTVFQGDEGLDALGDLDLSASHGDSLAALFDEGQLFGAI